MVLEERRVETAWEEGDWDSEGAFPDTQPSDFRAAGVDEMGGVRPEALVVAEDRILRLQRVSILFSSTSTRS